MQLDLEIFTHAQCINIKFNFFSLTKFRGRTQRPKKCIVEFD